MITGLVIKAYNGYYYVKTDDKVMVCSLRGRLKKENFSLVVGDNVELQLIQADKGVIEVILPRRNLLRRPLVANVDQVVLVFAAGNPEINTSLLDRFLVLTELSGLNAIICINKIDIASATDLGKLIDVYRGIGYQVIEMSAKGETGINDLRPYLIDKITVFAGPSGVGKSTILNCLDPALRLQTGEVSSKIGRGKHTTRYAQLLPLESGGYVVDTPGFSSTEFNDVRESDLAHCFREFNAYSRQCKFNTCLHYKEPLCAVKEAVNNEQISTWRYESYIKMLMEIKENKRG